MRRVAAIIGLAALLAASLGAAAGEARSRGAQASASGCSQARAKPARRAVTRRAAASHAARRPITAARSRRASRARARCRRGRAAFAHDPARAHARIPPLPASRLPAAGPATSPGAPSGAGAPADGAPPTPAPAQPVASSVGADAYDPGTFVLRLTRTSVPAGGLTIYFRNHDVAEHNLWLDPPRVDAASILVSGAVGEDEGAAKTVVVTPGTWRLYCSLPGHEAMTRNLAVT